MAHCPTRANAKADATKNMPQTATLSHTDTLFTEEKSQKQQNLRNQPFWHALCSIYSERETFPAQKKQNIHQTERYK